MSYILNLYAEHTTKTLLSGPPFTGRSTNLSPIYSGDIVRLQVYFVNANHDDEVAEHRYFRRVTRYASATVSARLGYFDNDGRHTIVDATGWTEIVPATSSTATVVRELAGGAGNQEYQRADFASEPSGTGTLVIDSAVQLIYWGDSVAQMSQDSGGVLIFQRLDATQLRWIWAANGSHALSTFFQSDYLPGWGANLNLTGAGVTAFLGTNPSRGAFLEIAFTPLAGDHEVVFQYPVTIKQALGV